MKCGGNLLIVTVILLLVVFFTPVVDGGSQPTGRPSRQPTSKPSKVPTPGPTSSPPPIITTLVNINGLPGSTGVGGPAAYALLSRPSDVFIDAAGNIYVVDTYNHRVLVVDHATGVITNVAGVGVAGYGGDHGSATSATLNFPYDLAIFGTSLYVTDTQNNRIRVIKRGSISTYAGNGQEGFAGDNGPSSNAKLWLPHGLAFDSRGALYFADYGNNRIRRVTPPRNGSVIATVAGSGVFGSLGDWGPATSAQLYNPLSVTVDKAGNLYIADGYNHRVRYVSATSGMMYTLIGTGRAGFADNCSPLNAQLNVPTSLFVDDSGMAAGLGTLVVWLTDLENNRVRRATFVVNDSSVSLVQTAPAAVITTVIGSSSTSSKFGTDSAGPATSATLRGPNGVFVDIPSGNVVFADTFSNSVRSARSLAPSAAPTFEPSVPGQSLSPSRTPTRAPTVMPSSRYPTRAPTVSQRPTSRSPTTGPTVSRRPTAKSAAPT